MGEVIKSNFKKFLDLLKEIGGAIKNVGVISCAVIYVGSQISDVAKTIDDYNNTIPLVQQLVKDLKAIQEEFKAQESYRKTVDELKIYTVSEIDWLINDSKFRIQNNSSLGYNYIQRLEYYKDNISFLTLKQKKDIEYILKVYYKQIKP